MTKTMNNNKLFVGNLSFGTMSTPEEAEKA